MEDNQEMSPLEIKIARQIEYYFGNHNLPRDKFLKEQLQLDDGWVPLETMLKFNRLKCLTTDTDVIIESLRKSKTGLLEVSEDKTKLRRIPSKPLPEMNEQYKDALKQRSVYIKGFPLDTTLDDIQVWLNGKGTIEYYQMRRTIEKVFKGSVFLTFDTEESAKQFVERTDIKTFKDNEMLIMLRPDYHAKKKIEWKSNKAAKAKQDKDEKQIQVDKEEMKSLDEQTGCLLKFSGALEFVSRSDFHELFSGHGQIKWIDFSRGAKEGTILFRANAREALDKATEANGGTLQLKDQDVAWEVVEEGDAEKELLKKMIQDQQETFNKRGRGRGTAPSQASSDFNSGCLIGSRDRMGSLNLGVVYCRVRCLVLIVCQVAEADQVAEEAEEEEGGGTEGGGIRINLSSKARRPCLTAITKMMTELQATKREHWKEQMAKPQLRRGSKLKMDLRLQIQKRSFKIT